MRTAAVSSVSPSRERRGRRAARPDDLRLALRGLGWERFAADARAAGATSLIVADLPAGDRPELRRVQLVAPTSTDERLRLAAEQTDGWLYLVTVTGTTGARDELSRGSRCSQSAPGRRRATRRSTPGSGSRRRSRRAPPRT